MSELKITRRGALVGAAGAGLAVSACSSEPGPDVFQPAPAEGVFRHGVASGDPDQTSIMLWTALSEDGGGYRGVELATDEAFTDIVFEQGEEIAFIQPQPLATLKILADGLAPGRRYFFRFRHNETHSPVGVTRTLPEGRIDDFTIAAFSCSNFPAGHFNAYAHMAREGADLVLHLGDYIYEYGHGGYATEDAEAMNRVFEPRHEILSYEDYVARHAQYKRDPDLQAAHAAAPWVMIWDDHETANDSYAEGAENHDAGEGDWSERVQAALRAWYDWTPSREPDDLRRRWAALEIGDLATLLFLETRLNERDRPLSWADCPVDFSGEVTEEKRAALAEWVEAVVKDPQRRLLGEEQLAFAQAAWAASVEAGKPWRVLANQVIMARVDCPDFQQTLPFWMRWWAQSQGVGDFIDRSRYDVIWNYDAWDGYPAERERLYAALREAGADILVLTGDTHNAWANDLIDETGARIGSEIGVTSVSSPGAFDSAPGPHMGRLFEAANRDVLYKEPYDRGWVRLVLTPSEAIAELVSMRSIKQRGIEHEVKARFRIRPALGGEVPQMEAI